VPRLNRDGLTLAYDETGSGDPPLLFIHGYTCDRSDFAPQVAHFRARHRVVAVDLRGHGESDAPPHDYAMATLADDVAWMAGQLGIQHAVAVGHSLGGNVAVELAVRHPQLLSAVVALDSPLAVPTGTLELLKPVNAGVLTPAYGAVLQQFLGMFLLPTDRASREAGVIERIPRISHQAAIETWETLFTWDSEAAIAACAVPLLYIDAGSPNADLARLAELSPQLTIGRTVGAGHWHQLDVPDQVNAMIERFLQVSLPRSDALSPAGNK
jgi:pimeloyl-ACP methyl ester carboxylesterase